MNEFTLIVPFYRNSAMLSRQIQEWNKYPDGVKVICVDDGSPEPALSIISDNLDSRLRGNDVYAVQLYRIGVDIPWNREGARNLGAHVAATEWIVQIDIDHILPADSAMALLDFLNPGSALSPQHSALNKHWYRFPRWRRGRADETRKKDRLADDCEYGEIHPHVDSYLVRREIYWKTGGYDEDYAGALGGGNMFLRRLEKVQPVALLPAPIRLEVYTRSEIQDASDWSLSRDKTVISARRRAKEARGDVQPKNPLRFPWERQL